MSKSSPKIAGVGLGLRWALLDEVLRGAADGLVKFFEISPENYMRRGGYFPEALERVADKHPIVTHGLMMSLGSTDAFDEGYFDELERFVSRFGAPWHSDHLTFSGIDGAVLHDLLPLPFTHKMAQHVADRVRWAQDRLGRPMAVENISYYLHLGESELTETEFIREVLEKADCQLLLDVNNIDVNAKNHGFDARQWLDAIPFDRVAEIHVAGPEDWDQGLLLDTHGSPVRDDVYDLLSYAVERTGPLPVLLERDNNIPALAELLAEVRRVDGTYQAAVKRWQAAKAAQELGHAA
ncbi:MAG: DUF692 domain-containing protein [Polyangiaceae bacterium]|jgi:hypothetical protein|nr:DUF692 domain-containing protein [Polyangiaceae bacterium]